MGNFWRTKLSNEKKKLSIEYVDILYKKDHTGKDGIECACEKSGKL